MNQDLDHIEASLRPLAVSIDEVKPDPVNARAHPQRNLEIVKASLAGFGQQKPIVVDALGVCIAGNGTLLAARALGWMHIAIVRSGLTGTDARAYSIADNRASDTSEWDELVVAEHLAALQNDETVDHTLTGFNDSEIDQFISEAMGMEDQPEPPDLQIKDTYQLLVICNDEADQKHLYDRLAQDGYTCRVLTL